MPGSRTSASAFRESGDFTGRRLARSRVFSIRLIPDWKVRAVLGSFLFFRLVPKTESRDAKRGGQGAQSRRRVSRICDFFGGKAPRGNEQTRDLPRDQSETARERTHACHDAAHLRVRGPRAHRAGGAHQPQRELRHGRRGGASRVIFPTRWRKTRRDASRDDSPRGVPHARDALRQARAPGKRLAPRGRGRERFADDRHFRGRCRADRPPRTEEAPNGPSRVFFLPQILTRSRPSPPPPRPCRCRRRPDRRPRW